MPFIDIYWAFAASSFGERYTRFVLACACRRHKHLSCVIVPHHGWVDCPVQCLYRCRILRTMFAQESHVRDKNYLTLLGELTASRCHEPAGAALLSPGAKKPIDAA